MAKEPFGEPIGPDGRLTAEARARAEEHVGKLFVNACPCCGNRQFALSDRLYAPAALGAGRLLDFGNTFPMVMLTCSNCKHVVIFAARAIGLYESAPQGEDHAGRK